MRRCAEPPLLRSTKASYDAVRYHDGARVEFDRTETSARRGGVEKERKWKKEKGKEGLIMILLSCVGVFCGTDRLMATYRR